MDSIKQGYTGDLFQVPYPGEYVCYRYRCQFSQCGSVHAVKIDHSLICVNVVQMHSAETLNKMAERVIV